MSVNIKTNKYQGICPHCGSEMTVIQKRIRTNILEIETECPKCTAVGVETYELLLIENRASVYLTDKRN